MSLAELLPTVRSLPRDEQVQLVHFLADELGRRDEATPNIAFEIFTPDPSPAAAEALLKLLADERTVA